MNSRDGLSVVGYIRQNFEQKCIIHEIIRTIIQFFKNKGGFLYVCGDGTFGKLGITEYYNKQCMEPTLVPSVNEVVDIAADNNHTMLVDYKGSIWAFGCGKYGRLGNNNTDNVDVQTPQEIDLKHRAIAVSVGSEHSLILADNGSVLSCGKNSCGQLGHGQWTHGDTDSQSIPKVIQALKEQKIVQISAGCYHNGALSESGILFMWGWSGQGQCGVGEEKGNRIYRPQMVKLNEKVSLIECGYHHSLLISMSNLLYSFGDGVHYKLGHGTEKNKYVPTLVDALKDVKIINVAGGGEHTLCVDDKFKVWAFGRNHHGQCGHSNTNYQKISKDIEYFKTNMIKAKFVAAGEYSSCVITQNNECFVFGDNGKYQIGLREKKNYFVPTKLSLSVQKVSMGSYHSTFISDYKKEK